MTYCRFCACVIIYDTARKAYLAITPTEAAHAECPHNPTMTRSHLPRKS